MFSSFLIGCDASAQGTNWYKTHITERNEKIKEFRKPLNSCSFIRQKASETGHIRNRARFHSARKTENFQLAFPVTEPVPNRGSVPQIDIIIEPLYHMSRLSSDVRMSTK